MSDKKFKIKVCGMREKENIHALAELHPDFIGFIFYPGSKRYVGDNFDVQLIQHLPSAIAKTGVFVNEKAEIVIQKAKQYDLHFVQLHGHESAAFCQQLKEAGLAVIKVFSIKDQFDFGILNDYEAFCSYFLFDTKGKDLGGNGVKFDWEVLQNYKGKLPYLLSGGIGPEDAEALKALPIQPTGIDINSCFEEAPALKNIDLLKQFFKELEYDKK